MTGQTLAKRMEARLAELGRAPITAAIDVGLERTYIRDLITGRKKSISSEKYELVARALDWTVQQLLDESAPAERPAVVRATEFDNPNLGPTDVEVLGITVGGGDDDDVDFWLNGEVVNRVRRPPGIRHAKNVFALYVGGESMVPRHRPSDLIYVQKAPTAAGDDIVIELKETNEGGDRKSYLKEYMRRAGQKIYCRQYNPKKDLQFDLSKIANIYRVIPLKELMG